MTSSLLENKILDLEARLRAENRANRENGSAGERADPFRASRPGSGRRPNNLGDVCTPTRTRKQIDLPVTNYVEPSNTDPSEVDRKIREIMKLTGIICIDGKEYQTEIKDLEHQGELGNGTCGHVVKMLHKPSNSVIAVKQMRRSGNMEENKRITMDLEVVLKSHDCDYIVKCFGCFITDADVWICMELMATCFDKLLKRLNQPIPEDILGKVTLATVKALHYLKESHGVIHRDVKPSNILLDEKGNIKLCDFGISGRLVDSKAKTKNAGCAAYMAPERIWPPDPAKPNYDIRADVWSLGITLVELATGAFPYVDCNSDFEVLTKVISDDPPSLPEDNFSPEFQDFVRNCLAKDFCQRPKYRALLKHPFLCRYEEKFVDVAAWFARATTSSRTDCSSRVQKRCSLFRSSDKGKSSEAKPSGVGAGFKCVRSCLTSKGGENNNNNNNNNNNDNNNKNNNNNKTKQSTTNAVDAPAKPKSDCEGFKGVWNSIMKSPLFSRKKKAAETNNRDDNGASPRVVRRQQQQQQQKQQHQQQQQYANNNVTTYSGTTSGNISPLILHRFFHQQIQHMNGFANKPHRSTSVSPSRGGGCDWDSVRAVRLQRPSPSPEPPPRINKMVSPLLMRRIHYTNRINAVAGTAFDPHHQLSPCLTSRLANCVAPEPPPRRKPYGESSSVPCSPVPYHRCSWQHCRIFNTTQ